MTGAVLRLALIAAVIVGVGVWGWSRNWSGTAVVLAMTLATALCWVPALLALEHITFYRRDRDGG